MNSINFYIERPYKRKYGDLPGLNTGIMAKLDGLIENVLKKKCGLVEAFVNIMMKVSIIKLAGSGISTHSYDGIVPWALTCL